MTKNIYRILSIIVLLAVVLLPVAKATHSNDLEETLDRLSYLFTQNGDGDVVTDRYLDTLDNTISITGYNLTIIDRAEFTKLVNSDARLEKDRLFVVISEDNPNLVVLLKRNDSMIRGYDRLPLRRDDLAVHEFKVDSLPYIKATVKLDEWPLIRNRPDGLSWMAMGLLDEFTLHLPGVGEFVPDFPSEG